MHTLIHKIFLKTVMLSSLLAIKIPCAVAQQAPETVAANAADTEEMIFYTHSTLEERGTVF